MKRWLLLLALPYVVTVSTDVVPIFGKERVEWGVGTYHAMPPFRCLEDNKNGCDWLYDLAYALNQANKERAELSAPCRKWHEGKSGECWMSRSDGRQCWGPCPGE